MWIDEHARLILWQTRPAQSAFSSVRKRCRLNLQFDMPDLNTGFALVVQLMNSLFQKNAARWNFQFYMGKQRGNTLFQFRNTLVHFCGEHAGSVSCRFCLGFALV